MTDKSVWTSRRDGSGAKPLLTVSTAYLPPLWSPDSRRFAWIDEAGALRVMGIDGTGMRQLSRETHAFAWSPDGRELAYEDCTSRCRIAVRAVYGGPARALTKRFGEEPSMRAMIVGRAQPADRLRGRFGRAAGRRSGSSAPMGAATAGSRSASARRSSLRRQPHRRARPGRQWATRDLAARHERRRAPLPRDGSG